jgi:hypothetical protein
MNQVWHAMLVLVGAACAAEAGALPCRAWAGQTPTAAYHGRLAELRQWEVAPVECGFGLPFSPVTTGLVAACEPPDVPQPGRNPQSIGVSAPGIGPERNDYLAAGNVDDSIQNDVPEPVPFLLVGVALTVFGVWHRRR